MQSKINMETACWNQWADEEIGRFVKNSLSAVLSDPSFRTIWPANVGEWSHQQALLFLLFQGINALLPFSPSEWEAGYQDVTYQGQKMGDWVVAVKQTRKPQESNENERTEVSNESNVSRSVPGTPVE